MKVRLRQIHPKPSLILFVLFTLTLGLSLIYGLFEIIGSKPAPQEQSEFDKAVYRRVEFFGVQTTVPIPTAEARVNLIKLLETNPANHQILQKLVDFEEKLGLFVEAEERLKSIADKNPQLLADFYTRRGEFEKKAEFYLWLFETGATDRRADFFEKLLLTAERHDLKEYLSEDFFQSQLHKNKGDFFILRRFIENLKTSKNFSTALKVLRENQSSFPDKHLFFRAEEISLLIEENKIDEAQKIYEKAFEPFWPTEFRDEFYDFLVRYDRLNSYHSKIKSEFKNNPADFTNALRLADFERDDSEKVSQIISLVERRRTREKIQWTADELITAAGLLIEAGDGAGASKFLYTLGLNFRLDPQSDLRRRVLYRLFVIFSEADDRQIPPGQGDLKTFSDIARTDLTPGLTTGLLSLIFNGQNPRAEFERKESTAVRLFNRETAFQIFEEYKTEFPDSAELAQMYLDLIRHYTAAKNPALAEKLLDEFQKKFPNFQDFPDASVKLAEAFRLVGNTPKERDSYQKALDFLGRRNEPKFPESSAESILIPKDFTELKPEIQPLESEPQTENIHSQNSENEIFGSTRKTVQNPLARKSTDISYSVVLGRLIGSLSRELQTDEILMVFTAEIAKYPDQPKLYEQMLSWLGQTNLTEKQFEIYQKALAEFPERDWQDRFARWLIRQKRQTEFENFSRQMLLQFDSINAHGFLQKFVDGRENSAPDSFDNRLYLALYSLAHQKFSRDSAFTKGLLRYYETNKMPNERRRLLLENFFISADLREMLLTDLVKSGELNAFLEKAETIEHRASTEILPYKLFRAEAELRRSRFENAVEIYRELSALFPFETEFSESYLSLTRSLGQTKPEMLTNSAEFAQKLAVQFPADKKAQTVAGEIQAELGNWGEARRFWESIVKQARGENDSYLETATLNWDYFQNDAALEIINRLRDKTGNPNLFAFESGAIFESKNETETAFDEYLKTFSDTDPKTVHRAKKRLETLFLRPEFTQKIFSAFDRKRRNTPEPFLLTYHFADLLFRVKRPKDAVELLKTQVIREKSAENLLTAQQFFRDLKDQSAVRLTLARLIQTSERPQDKIVLQIRLAESFADQGDYQNSSEIIKNLLGKNPKNYGVILRAEEFFREIGRPNEASAVIQNAVPRARGKFSRELRLMLAERFSEQNKLGQAETVLQSLFDENPDDAEIFERLAEVFVRTGQPAKLRDSFEIALITINQRGLEPNNLKFEIIGLRRRLISAFTKLKDFDSATAQFIEIINLTPEDEEIVKEAVNFAKRFGGAQNLRAYYLKLATESFKNYRWNVVLAEIYLAENDLPNAVKNLQTAISNQPARIELYESLLDVHLKSKDPTSALRTIEKMLELAPDDLNYLKQKIRILRNLGRFTQAEAEKQKLPAKEARKLEKSLEAETPNATTESDDTFFAKFEQQFENPFQSDLQAVDLKRYALIASNRQTLVETDAKSWHFRQKLLEEMTRQDSLQAGQAREKLKIFDAVWPVEFGRLIRQTATGDDFSAIEGQLKMRYENAPANEIETFSFLRQMTVEAGLNTLHEEFLKTALLKSNGQEKSQNLRSLIVFYQERADFDKIRELLKNESDDPQMLKTAAENARLLEFRDDEFSALRHYFELVDEPLSARFLELFYAIDRAQMLDLKRFTKSRQLQIINYLKQINDLASLKQAIENSQFSALWKISRTAEIGLQTETLTAIELDELQKALKISTIGEMVKSDEIEAEVLTSSDWFRLAENYGKGLFFFDRQAEAEVFLPATVEQKSLDSQMQTKLGIFYLQKLEWERALEHFLLSEQLKPADPDNLPYLGAAYFQLGEKEKAFEIWRKILETDGNAFENVTLYLQTLADFGQQSKALDELRPGLLKNLKTFGDGTNKEKDAQKILKLFQTLAETLADENKKADYFEKLCRELPAKTFLPRLLIDHSLITDEHKPKFYRILIDNTRGFEKYDFDFEFVETLEQVWDTDEAEIVFDNLHEFQIEEPENERLEAQKEFLDFLIAQKKLRLAESLSAETERSIQGHFARPVWLRLAKIRVLAEEKNSAKLTDLTHEFVGLKTSENVSKPALPSLERFLAVRQILAEEDQTDIQFALDEAFYARSLALNDIQTTNFSGLAEALFRKRERTAAIDLLKVFVELAETENHGEVLKILAEIPSIAKFSPTEFAPEAVRPTQFELETVLQLAAETAEKFQDDTSAKEFREKLLQHNPLNRSNKIRLAELWNRQNKFENALNLCLETISAQHTTRFERWSAMFALTRMMADDDLKWSIAKAEISKYPVDAEMQNAFETLSLMNDERFEQALEQLKNSVPMTPPLKFLQALAEKNLGRHSQSRQSFSETAEFSQEVQKIFGERELSPNAQIIEQFTTLGQPRAAIDWALKCKIHEQNYQTADLQNRFVELLAGLSKSAEGFGQFESALKFEKALQPFLSSAEEKTTFEIRLKRLENLAAEQNSHGSVSTITEKIVSD